MRITADLLDEILAHAREEYDAECCGLIAYAPASDDMFRSQGDPAGERSRTDERDGAGESGGAGRRGEAGEFGGRHDNRVAVRIHRATNTFASRKRFEIDGRELLRTINEFEDEDWELGAIYHSHTHTAPYPSQTDINFAANWPGLEWVIVGLAGPGSEPEVRCYLIDDGQVREVELRVD